MRLQVEVFPVKRELNLGTIFTRLLKNDKTCNPIGAYFREEVELE